MKQLKQLIALLMVELIIFLPIAIVDALTISDVRAEEITPTSANIRWNTSESSYGSVDYGASTQLSRTESSQNFVQHHSIPLNNLNENTTYYFKVTSDSVIGDNQGSLYTLTTLPATPLFLNASIPADFNQKTFSLQGKSIRLARINLYINSNSPRTLNADNNGNFVFTNVNLNEGNNTIRLTAESQNNRVEKVYPVNIDTSPPLVSITEIPGFVGEETITINGTVNEQSTVYVFVANAQEDTTPPPKITNLINTSIEANNVEITWDTINISDFNRYIIFRDNKPIAASDDPDYNDFTDVFVNSNQTYVYEVAAMDKKGNLGQRSSQLAITTLEGGLANRQEPAEIDLNELVSGLEAAIQTSDIFNQEINLPREDGYYRIKVDVVDKAQNKWTYEKEFLLDTKNPEIEILSPKGNSEIFESYADMVAIRGKTEPGARVYLYIKRTPFGEFNRSFELSLNADEIQDIPESSLRANCRLAVAGKENCKTNADYETVADEQGFFQFDNVDLTVLWGGALRITEYATGAPYYDLANQESLKDYIESNAFFVAVDNAGRKGFTTIDYEIVTCWTTDFTWDSTPLIEYQSPSFLSVERLKEGSEVIYFYLNFTYHGRGKEGKLTSLSVLDACGSGYLERQERYNYSCKILRSCTEKLSPNGKTAYIACPLQRLEGIEVWTDKDWESFIDAVHNEMTFPFRLTLGYDETSNNGTIEYSKRHIMCTEVGYVVDAAYINPKEMLPDWLLYDFVDFLNSSISTLTDWITTVEEILQWAAIGCMVTFLVKFVTQIYRRITCAYDELWEKVGGTLQRIGGDSGEDPCLTCINNNKANENPQIFELYKNQKSIQEKVSDTCLKVCYPSCASAWESEQGLYQTYRWACDRVFGHASPSKWTESATDTTLFQKLSEGSGCSSDQSVRGRPLRAIQCKEVEEKYNQKNRFDRDDKCLEIASKTGAGTGEETLYLIDALIPEGENVYRITAIKGPDTIQYRSVVKQDEDNYLAPMEQTCQEICEGELTGKRTLTPITARVGKKEFTLDEGLKSKKATVKGEQKESTVVYGCVTPNQCISYKSGDQRTIKLSTGTEEKDVEVKSATPMGYTRDCWDPATVSSNPDTRIECCCINSQKATFPQYYKPGDVENKDNQFSGDQGYGNMGWSYRYWKEEWQSSSGSTKYNENRYIEGRDQMACFGQNSWLYDGFTSQGTTGKLLIIDPTKQHIAAFQCAAISQIRNRLVLLKNIMVSLENCLLSIRTTGQADAGVCKELFTQYVCAFIWKIITWFRNGCLPFGEGIDFAKSENEVLKAVSVGMSGIWDSVEDSQQELASEYSGNAKLNNLLGLGEEDVFRKVCLGAFGYDWEINVESVLDAAYSSPYATLVQPVLASREYLTFDPTNYKSRYEYRSGWLINPGCDLDNYEVFLTCVTRNDMQNHADIDCVKQKDPWGKNCDCLDSDVVDAPKDIFYQSQSSIKQNQLVEIDSSQIQDRIKTSDYRYDHLMFRLNVDRNYDRNKADISQCFPDGHGDGIFYFPITDYTAREIAGCHIDVSNGKFSCGQGASFFYEQGNAFFTSIELEDSLTDNIQQPKIATFFAEDNKWVNAIVKYSKDDRKQCLISRLIDKDGVTILSNNAAIDLPKGTLSGEVRTGNIYQIGNKDLTGGGAGFKIEYTNQNAETLLASAGAKLSYTVTQAATSTMPSTSNLNFFDKNNDGVITIARNSPDKYAYANGQEQDITNPTIEINLANIGARISVTGTIQPTSPGKFEFMVTTVQAAQQQPNDGAGARFYLHLDLRYPKTADGSCDEVRGFNSDNEKLIVANGIRQSVNIPIMVTPGKGNVNACDPRFEREEILKDDGQKQNNLCVCSSGSAKNCPTDAYNFCYGRCRQYPKCSVNTLLNAPCVCKIDTAPAQVDCGDTPQHGFYCYQAQGDTKLDCHTTPPPTLPAGPVDNTPLQVTLQIPDPNGASQSSPYPVYSGETISIQVGIVDDMPSGNEQYEIILSWNDQGTKTRRIATGYNTQKAARWIINADWTVREPISKDVSLKVVGIDGTMASESRLLFTRVSAKAP